MTTIADYPWVDFVAAARVTRCTGERRREVHADHGTTPADRPIASVIHEGLPTQLPDIDPDETQEWLDVLRRAASTSGAATAPAT